MAMKRLPTHLEETINQNGAILSSDLDRIDRKFGGFRPTDRGDPRLRAIPAQASQGAAISIPGGPMSVDGAPTRGFHIPSPNLTF